MKKEWTMEDEEEFWRFSKQREIEAEAFHEEVEKMGYVDWCKKRVKTKPEFKQAIEKYKKQFKLDLADLLDCLFAIYQANKILDEVTLDDEGSYTANMTVEITRFDAKRYMELYPDRDWKELGKIIKLAGELLLKIEKIDQMHILEDTRTVLNKEIQKWDDTK